MANLVNKRTNDPALRSVIEKDIKSIWLDLKGFANHVKDNTDGKGYWRRNGRNITPSWGRGSYSSTTEKDILDSMRDVGENVWFASNDERRDKPFGKLPVGHIFSHALPGGLWDFDADSYMTMGINHWNMDDQQRRDNYIDEAVIEELLPNFKLLKPPTNKDQGNITVQKFPWHYMCSGTPGHLSAGKYNSQERKMQCAHLNCKESIRPVRFVSICDRGHIAPFDWDYWVHSENGWRECKLKNIKLEKFSIHLGKGSSNTLSAWNIRCRCGISRTLSGVTSTRTTSNKKCSSYSPWISTGKNEQLCEVESTSNGNREPVKMANRQRGSSSVALPALGSILLIPPDVNWHLASHNNIATLITYQERQQRDNPNFVYEIDHERFLENWDDLWSLDIKEFRRTYTNDPNGKKKFLKEFYEWYSRDSSVTKSNLRIKERQGLTPRSRSAKDYPDFLCYTEFGGDVFEDEERDMWESDEWPIEDLSRVERLKELIYIDGVQRLNAIDKQPLGEKMPNEKPVGIGRYNYGEGIYIGLKTEWLDLKIKERNKNVPIEITKKTMKNIKNWSISKELNLSDPVVASALPIVHTFSHLMIRELCNESGYGIGSIKERLYIESKNNKIENAGVFFIQQEKIQMEL